MNLPYKLFALLVSLFITTLLSAQHERDNWYFGLKGGIKFVNGVATPDQNSNLKNYPSSCISNKKTGELLFYTDGKKVWNKNHTIMDGGDSIVGYFNKYFNATTVITPYPGDDFKYYIFTGVKADKPERLCYAIVDMRLNNGLGKVISNDNFIKNIPFGYGNITAVSNTCGNSIWIISGYSHIGVDSFYCFQVGLSGVNKKPVITTIQNNATKKSPMEIKTNIQGDALVILSLGGFVNEASTYKFDNLTGIVSNKRKLSKSFPIALCAEFSPDGSKIYVGYQIIGPPSDSLNPSGCIFQYSDTNFSKENLVLYEYNKRISLDFIKGPDDKIYIAKGIYASATDTIDAIEKPNEPAVSCSYKKNAIIRPGISTGRFPLFVNKSLPTIKTSIEGIITNEICIHDTVKCFISENTSVDSVFWDFGDTKLNDTSTLLNAEYNYQDTGYKTITARWYACGQQSTITKKLYVYPPPTISLGVDKVFCNKSAIIIKPSGNFKGIEWSTGDKSDTLSVSKTGTYWVKTGIANCKAYDTIKISELPPILIKMKEQYAICTDNNEEVKLDAGKGYSSYNWIPSGDTTQWITVKEVGNYYVEVIDQFGCKGNDSAQVMRLCDFTFFIPNAFSPNGDGKNDLFGATCSDVSDYYFEIFNRWGEKVFESTDPQQTWNGFYNEKPAPYGHYIWYIRLKGVTNKVVRDHYYKGIVTLIK